MRLSEKPFDRLCRCERRSKREPVDGSAHELDVIIYGTGFHASQFLNSLQVTGRGGVDLHSQWGVDAQAYQGVCVPNLPNLFMNLRAQHQLDH